MNNKEQLQNLKKIPELQSQLDDKANRQCFNKPNFYDMHFGALKGVGFIESSKWNEKVTQNVSIGANKIKITNGSNFKNNELVVYLGDDGVYRSATIRNIINNEIELYEQVESNLSTDCFLYHAYANYSHLTTYGYKMVVDYCINNINNSTRYEIESRLYPETFNFTNCTTAIPSCNNYADTSGIYINFKNSSSKMTKNIIPTKMGNYAINIVCDTITTSNTITVNVKDGNNTIISKSISGAFPTNQYICETILESKEYTIEIIGNENCSAFISHIDIISSTYDGLELKNINNGVHLVLGDSWIAQEGFVTRLQERLSNAKVVNFGVGGNRAIHALRRYTGIATNEDRTDPYITDDVWELRKDATKIEEITDVWICIGTNDYLQGYSKEIFYSTLRELISKIINNGQKCHVLTTSVGDVNKNNGTISTELLKLSREYASFMYSTNSNSEAITTLSNKTSLLESLLLESKTKIFSFKETIPAKSKSDLFSIVLSNGWYISIKRIDIKNIANTEIKGGVSTTYGDTNVADFTATPPTGRNIKVENKIGYDRYFTIYGVNNTDSEQKFNISMHYEILKIV